MTPEIFIKRQLKAQYVKYSRKVQSLWSDYGEISKYVVGDEQCETTIIVKHICLPKDVVHVRGWHSELAHNRKVKSYQVEVAWYQHWATRCSYDTRVARCYGSYVNERSGDQYLLLEDLDAIGFGERHALLSVSESLVCLNWLASFHAEFLQSTRDKAWPEGLWSTGTYWHLATRKNEWLVMADSLVKESAKKISEVLLNARFKTLVHGDAKVANFCFSADGKQVAAVDFQYIGAGIGVQDLAYFLGSALSEEDLKKSLPYLLEHYFAELGQAIVARGESQNLATAVIEEWQSLFNIAWADFQRFILGWSPNHIKNTALSQSITKQGLAQLDNFR